MMYWHDGGWGPGMWIATAFMLVLLSAIVVAVVVALLRSNRDNPSSAGEPSRRSAAQILDERFARGEIDADEYTRRRELLRSG